MTTVLLRLLARLYVVLGLERVEDRCPRCARHAPCHRVHEPEPR